ncbi:MAG: hypothetical protein CMJ18_02690 [Phycisphaeraceae bacterium]|nr:hypothetical protein [Phycisphaeraceae bacterium]
MVTKKATVLHQIVRDIFIAAGTGEADADLVAEHLVSSNLRGVDTHGIIQVPLYVRDIREGRLRPGARPRVARRIGSGALVDGQWTFGQVSARFAMEQAIELAGDHRMAVVGLVASTHIGRLGHYVEMAARRQLISIIIGGGYCRDAPRTVPFGGREGALDTNPIAMGFPGLDEEVPILLDFATTTASGVKVINAQRRGEQVPPGWIVDSKGRPTTDPQDFANGGFFAPFGGHKGYALMFAAEMLGRVFTGSDTAAEDGPDYPMFRNQGVTMIVFQADLFSPYTDYEARARELAEEVRGIPPAEGFDRVMIPGDPDRATTEQRSRDGIPIADDIWEQVVEAGRSVGVEVA